MATLIAVPSLAWPFIFVSCMPANTAPKLVVGVLRTLGPVPAMDMRPTADSGLEEVLALKMRDTASDWAEKRLGLRQIRQKLRNGGLNAHR
jgi:hypothetical protein